MSDSKDLIVTIAGREVTPVRRAAGPIVTVAGKPIPVKTRQGVDLVFVIDTTGSMSDKIQGLLSTCAQFAGEFAALGLAQRMAVVAFGDLTVPGDKIETTKFTSNVEILKKSFRHIPRYFGGGNEGESSLEALEKAMALPFQPGAVKALLLITDDAALQHNITASTMIGRLVESEFLVFVVSPRFGYFQEMAKRCGGSWHPVSASTDLASVLEMFRSMAKQVSRVVSDVHRLGDGSVAEYLRLTAPE